MQVEKQQSIFAHRECEFEILEESSVYVEILNCTFGWVNVIPKSYAIIVHIA